jgi:hypothetical protein
MLNSAEEYGQYLLTTLPYSGDLVRLLVHLDEMDKNASFT